MRLNLVPTGSELDVAAGDATPEDVDEGRGVSSGLAMALEAVRRPARSILETILKVGIETLESVCRGIRGVVEGWELIYWR